MWNADVTPECRTCGYYDYIGGQGDVPFGLCKFSAPVIHPGELAGNCQGYWPETSPKDWCARWVPTPDEFKKRIRQKVDEFLDEQEEKAKDLTNIKPIGEA